LDQELEGNALMLRTRYGVGLLTDHIPVNEVSLRYYREINFFRKSTLFKTLKQDFGITKPKLPLY
jgi:4-hydroxythreonine-4-phosphate dehydrogenase